MADEIKKDTVDYRDPTPFDDTKLNSISEISKGIRHKYFGKDTREALAQQGEALVKLIQETGGNQSAEVAAARGNHELLQMREDAQDEAIVAAKKGMNDSLATKRDKMDKIRREDLDTSTDGYKIGLNNLSEEVQATIAGKAPVIASVADKSLTSDKYADGSVGFAAITKHLLNGTILPSTSGIPSYDTNTGVFDFKSVENNKTMLYYAYKAFPIPPGTTVVNTNVGTSIARLVFSAETKTFRFLTISETVSDTDVLVATFRLMSNGKAYASANFQISINGAKVYGRTDELSVSLLNGDKGFPIWDDTAGTLTFPRTNVSYVGYDILVGDMLYQQVITSEGLTVQFPPVEELATGAQMLMFNTNTKSIFVCGYNELANYGAYCAVLGTVRTLLDRSKYYANFKFKTVEPPIPAPATDNPIDAAVLGINHRGFNTVAPEESAPAYLLSKKMGYNHWEGDIQFTKDNIPVMSHDATVNRIARNMDGSTITDTVKFIDKTYEELNLYDWGVYKGEAYQGTELLKLEDLLVLARKYNTRLHLEIKSRYTDEQYQVLYDLFQKYRMWDSIGLQSFNKDWYTPLTALKESYTAELLCGKSQTANTIISNCTALSETGVNVIASIESIFTNDDIAQICGAGFDVYVWTVDDGDTARRLATTGVRGIITDGNINVADELKL